jgi:hypothetical protein
LALLFLVLILRSEAGFDFLFLFFLDLVGAGDVVGDHEGVDDDQEVEEAGDEGVEGGHFGVEREELAGAEGGEAFADIAGDKSG